MGRHGNGRIGRRELEAIDQAISPAGSTIDNKPAAAVGAMVVVATLEAAELEQLATHVAEVEATQLAAREAATLYEACRIGLKRKYSLQEADNVNLDTGVIRRRKA